MAIVDYIGIPYDDGKTGADCWRLVQMVHAGEFGGELPGYTYSDASDYQEISGVIGATKESPEPWRQVDEPKPGDLLLFKVAGRDPTHIGIYVGDRRFLHTMEATGSMLQALDAFWKKRLVGCWRYEP